MDARGAEDATRGFEPIGTRMSCDEIFELLELYALGALDAEERTEVAQHLATGCPICNPALQRASGLNAAVLASVDVLTPPAHLRQRVMNLVTPPAVLQRRPTPARPSSSWAWIGIAAALACLALWLGSRWQNARTELASTLEDLGTERRERQQVEAALNFLKDPETRPAAAKPEANRPRGTYFVNPRAGVLLIASNLPQLDASKTYEMWVIPKGQAPRPAGLFRPDAAGAAVHLRPGPVNPANTAAIAISVEPASGSPAPTTTPQLVTPVQGG